MGRRGVMGLGLLAWLACSDGDPPENGAADPMDGKIGRPEGDDRVRSDGPEGRNSAQDGGPVEEADRAEPQPRDGGIPLEQGGTALGDAGLALDGGEPSPSVEAPSVEAPCADEAISQLMLLDRINPATIESTAEADGFHARLDASAGGVSPTEGYVYARFTEEGLAKVELGDEDALASTEWHIALRRYVVRLNSGVSGPAEVLGASTAPGTRFEELEGLPPDLRLQHEAYFTDLCDYVMDASGIGAPATVLSTFWSYTACVQMTGNVYVIRVGPEQTLKLQVLAYYADDNQAVCDETGEVPQPSFAAQFHLRWAWLSP